MLTVTFVLVAAAFICTIAGAIDRCPLWVPVMLLALVHLVAILPR